ncbi:MAG TPA: Gfo/Idh/MocA family oxidoreductase [Candidatus Saccharimonadales bacterium]|nr:Gfo/Idh/MocA family oxidoreductase [Candidatus Saccharimonadales bacterium]
MSGTEIGFGILGSGNMARVYGDALATQVEGGRLVALALGSRARALAAEFGVSAEASAEALVARSDVDVVVVATPHSTHVALAVLAAQAGKHIYLEKPMALDVAECDTIIDACRKAGVQLTIAKQTRHMQMAMRAKEYLDQGLIGQLLYLRPMSVTPGAGFASVENHWAYDPSEGDAFLDWGSHACDAIRWFGGADAVRVYADYDNITGQPLESPTAAVQIRLSNRVIAQILLCYEIGPSGFGSRRNNQYQLLGTEGSIFWDLDRVELVTGARDERIWELPSWTLPDFKPRDPRRIGNTARQIDDFIGALRQGRAPTITGADGRAAIEMTQAAKQSAQTHRAVHLPLAGTAVGSVPVGSGSASAPAGSA